MAEEPNATEQERPESGAPEEPKGTLEEQLEGLRNHLKAAQQKLTEAGFDIAQDKWQIDALAKLIADLEQTVTDYRPEYPGLKAAETAYRDYSENEVKCLKEILGDANSQAVEKIAKEIRAAVVTLSDDIAAHETALAGKKKDRETKLKNRDRLKAEFESLMKPVASIKDRLKELETFKGEIRKAHDDGEYAIAYWLLIDAKKFAGRLNGKPKLFPPDQLRDALKVAWNAYRKVADEFQDLDADVQEAEKALVVEKAKLTDMKKNLDANIRSELTKLLPSRSEAA